ncbi:MAG: proline--tRNA ligase [Nanoarchaeota archaeon]
MADEKTIGITVKKADDISEWYTQVIQKGELAEYTDVSGCMVIRPRAYAMWEKVQEFFDAKIKKMGVANAYFPMLIPEHLLNKEKEHVEGFSPEVAWVTHGGNSKLSERLAIRPTSETIMYDSYKKWIRSHQDLPLKINQWCNIVRWEFKNPTPFLRGREFLWQEGHTVFSDEKEAEKEVWQIIDLYAAVMEDLFAVPVFKGRKTDVEKFAGAVFTASIETVLPQGKAIQVATSHMLGQNFSKAFGITYLDKDEKKKHPFQNSWGISTRAIGIMVMMHSDDKGLVIPPAVAPVHVVIVPIRPEKEVMDAVERIRKDLHGYTVIVDDRKNYSPGFKFNDWEMKGIPIRIEIGPKDVKDDQVILVRRDTGEKSAVKMTRVVDSVKHELDAIQKNLLVEARKRLEALIIDAKDIAGFKKALSEKRIVRSPFCMTKECEKKVAEMYSIKTLNFDPTAHAKGTCLHCGKEAKAVICFGRSY